MNNERIRTYDELEADEKEVLDVFRQMKLLADYNKFKLYKYKVEDLIEDYEELKNSVKKSRPNTFQFMTN